MPTEVWGAIIGGAVTVVVAIGGALLGRRWNLPGLGREIESQQTILAGTLRARIEALEEQHEEDERRIKALENCTDKLADVERQLRNANADILALYRKIGQPRPRREPPP